MKSIILLVLFVSLSSAVKLGSVPPSVVLTKDTGGKVKGGAWRSSALKGKVQTLFYVDPDEKDLNSHVSEALSELSDSGVEFQSTAIINMAATWLPNFAIANALKKKQKKYPNAIYVKDLDKVLVNKWHLKDDSSNILLFNKEGKLIFINQGKVSKARLKEFLQLIKDNA